VKTISKSLLLVIALLITPSILCAAQTTRPAVVSWNASSSSGVNGYNLYRCQITSGTSCTPGGTALNGSTLITTLSFTDNPTIGNSYMYGIVAVAGSCTASTPVTSVCGSSPMATSAAVPVPQVPSPVTTIVVTE